ncbi:MAG TPA: sigma-70 family RNA polymerase sigma factor [Mizugakiibacter sp.]
MPRADSRDARPDAGRRPAPPDEAALVARVAAADRTAFEALYRAYYPRLRRFLERMTRRLPLVEEVLNDTMMVVWRRAHTYDRVSKVSTWIFAIAYRQALKALSRVDDAVPPADGDEAVPAHAQPESVLQREQWRAHLGQALGALSAEQRAVIELTYYNGYACREVAEIMGCPVDTVKTRMFYARRKLKTLLALNAEDAI